MVDTRCESYYWKGVFIEISQRGASVTSRASRFLCLEEFHAASQTHVFVLLLANEDPLKQFFTRGTLRHKKKKKKKKKTKKKEIFKSLFL